MIDILTSANTEKTAKQVMEQKLIGLKCNEDGHDNYPNQILIEKENNYSIVRCCCETFAASIRNRIG
jgi:hypothetical protein